jgi:hypothetical protein
MRLGADPLGKVPAQHRVLRSRELDLFGEFALTTTGDQDEKRVVEPGTAVLRADTHDVASAKYGREYSFTPQHDSNAAALLRVAPGKQLRQQYCPTR